MKKNRDPEKIVREIKRNEIDRLPRNIGRRAIHTRRNAKQAPSHPIQLDVKFVTLIKVTAAKSSGINILQ